MLASTSLHAASAQAHMHPSTINNARHKILILSTRRQIHLNPARSKSRNRDPKLMANPNPLPSTRHLLTSLITAIASSTRQKESNTPNPLSSTTTSQNTKSAFLTLHSLFPHDFLPALDLLDRGLVTRFVLAEDSEGEEQRSETAEGLESDLVGGGGGNAHGDQTEYKQSKDARHGAEQTTQDENQTQDQIPNQKQIEQRTRRKRKQTVIYQVRSAQRIKTHSSSRSEQSTAATAGTSYEVRLKAWNCSCPAFAFAALPIGAASPPSPFLRCDGSGGDGYWDGGIGRDGDDAVGYGLGGDQHATNATITTDEDEDMTWLGFGGLTRGQDVPACKHLLACVVAERFQGFEQLVEEKGVGAEEVAGWAAGWGD